MPLLEARAVSHWFGGLCAVEDFNLLLEPGELRGIIGPNGAGKTTVFNLVTGVYRATQGSIRFKGTELVGRSPHQVTGLRIARTFQNIRLFKELSVLDNVRIAHFGRARYSPLEALFHVGRYGREERRIRDHSLELLAAFQLDGYAGEAAKNLPYGEQRRLEIARALATNPTLLCLDEPAAGFNPAEKADLLALIRRIRDTGVTVLLIEHDMRLVMGVTDRIVVLEFGKKIAEGTPAQVQKDAVVVKAYLGEDFEVA
jgi:branched-chain amino acid transport system ATP-binding protein